MLTPIINVHIVATLTFCVVNISICDLEQAFMECCKLLITVVIAHAFEIGSSQFKNGPNFRLVRVISPVQKLCIGTSSF